MTTGPRTTPRLHSPAQDILPLPDPRPCDLDMSTFEYLNFPAYPPMLADHLGNPETTIITSEVGASVRPTTSYRNVLYPDLLIAFNADPAARKAHNGYIISEQGKPPDFVLEIASPSTARKDETEKRDAYADMGIPEYWRFDAEGSGSYSSPLAGDRLVDGRYEPISINESGDGDLWGHSAVLNLDLCWEKGQLRFWDPGEQRFLPNHSEILAQSRASDAARAGADVARAEADARSERLRQKLNSEQQARQAAEARIRELEEKFGQ